MPNKSFSFYFCDIIPYSSFELCRSECCIKNFGLSWPMIEDFYLQIHTEVSWPGHQIQFPYLPLNLCHLEMPSSFSDFLLLMCNLVTKWFLSFFSNTVFYKSKIFQESKKYISEELEGYPRALFKITDLNLIRTWLASLRGRRLVASYQSYPVPTLSNWLGPYELHRHMAT